MLDGPGPPVKLLAMMKQSFARVFLRKPVHQRGEPPAPDTGAVPEYPGQAVVSVHYSPSNRWRLIVTKDQRGTTFRVHQEFWDTMDWSDWGHALWVGEGGGSIHFCDTQDRAEELAIVELRGKE